MPTIRGPVSVGYAGGRLHVAVPANTGETVELSASLIGGADPTRLPVVRGGARRVSPEEALHLTTEGGGRPSATIGGAAA